MSVLGVLASAQALAEYGGATSSGGLSALSNRHDRLTGKSATVRRHTPWLRSMSGERPANMPGVRAQLNALEYVLVVGVILAVLAFEYWFFFKAGSPLDGRSGRN